MNNNVQIIPAKEISIKTGRNNRTLRVAAYCRVSTDEEKQLGSFENQIEYFDKLIRENKRYKLVKIYSDEGISGTNIKRRIGFKEMISDCESGKIDLIITKSISRFARNTQDSLNYTRKLKDMDIGIYFEKEGINTLESSGELLLTLFSCFAQEESRSISENTAWGIRSKFRQGIPHLNAKNLYAYDKDENGKLIINEKEAEVVKRIYAMFLEGYSLNRIAKVLNDEGIKGVRNETKWCAVTLDRRLKNEKYNGSILMQKTFTSNYLTKQHTVNKGQLNQYYIENDHEAIIPKEIWKAVQEETERRKQFIINHNLRGLSRNSNSAFYAKVFCNKCNYPFQRIYKYGVKKPYWECPKCKKKIDEEKLRSSFCDCYNKIVTDRSDYLPKWRKTIEYGTPLEAIRAIQMIDIIRYTIPFEIKEVTQMILQKAIVYDNKIVIVLLSNDKLII